MTTVLEMTNSVPFGVTPIVGSAPSWPSAWMAKVAGVGDDISPPPGSFTPPLVLVQPASRTATAKTPRKRTSSFPTARVLTLADVSPASSRLRVLGGSSPSRRHDATTLRHDPTSLV